MIPLFTSHYSKGKSILSLAEPQKTYAGGPDSIIKLCKNHNIQKPFLIENTLTGLMEAVENFSKEKISFVFGWKTNIVNDLKSEEEGSFPSKIIILVKNTNGYHDLLKLHNSSQANHNGKVDFEFLNEFLTKNLKIAIPFYNSYIFNNLFIDTFSQPNIKPLDPVFFAENNKLPFDNYLLSALPPNRTIKTKTIYYNKRSDFEVWQTYRCLCDIMIKGRRRSLNLPMFDHCASNEFCLESWLENS
jgi:hypothetical protein